MTHLEKTNSVCAVIPFYNEKTHLKQLISEVLNYVDLIIAVDDGSTDESLQIVKQFPEIVILKNERNYGKGFALKVGFKKSIELKTKYTITLDADMQHAPKIIPGFIEKLNDYDVIIGNRLHNKKGMPIQRKLSNYLTSKILGIKTGYKILDSQSGYRAFRTEILKDILPKENGFEAESEMIVRLLKANYSLGFVNIPTIYGDDTSKMKAWQTIKGFIKVILKKY